MAKVESIIQSTKSNTKQFTVKIHGDLFDELVDLEKEVKQRYDDMEISRAAIVEPAIKEAIKLVRRDITKRDEASEGSAAAA